MKKKKQDRPERSARWFRNLDSSNAEILKIAQPKFEAFFSSLNPLNIQCNIHRKGMENSYAMIVISGSSL